MLRQELAQALDDAGAGDFAVSGLAFTLEQVAEPREVGVAKRLEFLVELLGPGRAVALDDLALEREAGVEATR